MFHGVSQNKGIDKKTLILNLSFLYSTVFGLFGGTLYVRRPWFYNGSHWKLSSHFSQHFLLILVICNFQPGEKQLQVFVDTN